MALENAIWGQAGFKGPTQCSGLGAKPWGKHKTKHPLQPQLFAQLAKDPPGTSPPRVLCVPCKVVTGLLPRCFYFLCKCALISTRPNTLALVGKGNFFSVRHAIHTESHVQGPDNVILWTNYEGPRALSLDSHSCARRPDVAAWGHLHRPAEAGCVVSCPFTRPVLALHELVVLNFPGHVYYSLLYNLFPFSFFTLWVSPFLCPLCFCEISPLHPFSDLCPGNLL